MEWESEGCALEYWRRGTKMRPRTKTDERKRERSKGGRKGKSIHSGRGTSRSVRCKKVTEFTFPLSE